MQPLRITRRSFVAAGALAAGGLGLADLLRLEARGAENRRGKNAIFIFLTGGQSHIDTWDMKPEGGEVAGEFKPIDTNLPGLRICEHMPHLARCADRFAVLRGVTHNQGAHSPGQRLMQTGNRQIPSLEYPDYGAVVSRELAAPRGVPPYILLPGAASNSATYSAGYLGVAYGPFTALGDPNAADYSVRALKTPEGFTLAQMQARMALLNRVDTKFRSVDVASQDLEGMDRAYQQAYEILQSPAVREGFDIGREEDAVRGRYGRNAFGQSCLLARRLIEAGTRCVSLYSGGWDTHRYNFRDLRDTLLPPWDQGLSALVEDLQQRGLLRDTVVWCTGEFGRTPKINDNNAGRDHWPRAMSMVFAGGGLKTGQVIGATDDTASEPTDAPYKPEDAAASFYRALGIDPQTEYHTPDGRPVQIVRDGEPIRELFS